MPRCVTAVSDQLKEPKASRAEAGIVGLERQRFLLHLVFLGYLFVDVYRLLPYCV